MMLRWPGFYPQFCVANLWTELTARDRQQTVADGKECKIFRHFPFVPVLCRSLYVICCFFWTQFGHKKGRAICFVDQIEIHTPITSAELRVANCATGKTLSICIF